ncbi:MAG: chemotaxis protein CheA [Burkholderiaceae bacterium]|nr:MAG: chemotaxis protein CheA [Burkholderiaceae bacterium]
MNHDPGSGLEAGQFDMSQFHQVFFEESYEHLRSMEALLLELDLLTFDHEVMNAIFRAAHSIKGSSATFGMQEIADLTHEAENLLDKVRNRELEMTVAMVDTLLEAGDAIRQQLDCRRDGVMSETPDTTALKARLKALADPAAAEFRAPDAQGMAPQSSKITWRIIVPLPGGTLEEKQQAWFLGELRTFGVLDEAPESGRDGALHLRLTTADPVTELPALINFMLSIEGTTVTPVDTAHQAQAVSEAYGLFHAAAAAPVDDNGYGFFDAPALPAIVDAAVAASAPVAASNQSEPVAKPAARKAAEEASIRVSVEKVDQLINLVGELVITQAGLLQNVMGLDAGAHPQLFSSLTDLERHTRDLQESVLGIRMLPISNVFNRFPRMLRDLAAKLGKQVELKTLGEGTELDKGLIEKITDPLTHLVRNALDHGIELPEVRRQVGKPDVGTITLRAAQRGGNIVIEVSDDGGGLRRDKIIAKARERGLAIADQATDTEVWNLIFAPGFSTADAVTDVSGRGVGMDVVKRNILSLGGSVEIDSSAGMGSKVTIRLPLTLAIMDGMSVALGDEVYVLPLASVIESIPLRAEQVRSISGHGNVIEVRQEYLPVLDLRTAFQVQRKADAIDIAVIIEAEGVKTALLVDELVGQQQVVVKNLESNYRRVPSVSGATILGDGRVALILDVNALVKRSRH